MKRFHSYLLALLVFSLLSVACGQSAEGGESRGWLASIFSRGEPVVIPAGTQLTVTLSTGVSSKNNEGGDSFEGTLEEPVVVGDRVVIPAGADVEGKVAYAVPSGRLKQRAEIWLTLTEVNVDGTWYDVATTNAGRKEGSKAKRDILFIGGGAGAGALIGGLTGGGKGAAIGAGIGAGGGTAGAALTGQRDIHFPPESRLRFRLKENLEVRL
ncbi:MAG: hypothetical protein ACRD4D_01785 [Candidatus Acidiferrales bacterium]